MDADGAGCSLTAASGNQPHTVVPAGGAVGKGVAALVPRTGTLLALGRLAGLFSDTFLAMAGLMCRTLVSGRDEERTAAAAQAWARRTVARCGVHVSVRGRPPTRPCVLVANHRSYLDIAVLLSQVPCLFLAKRELASWPILGPAARCANTLFVDRGDEESRRSARDSLGEAVSRGRTVAVFPEGTTSAGPDLLPFRPGVFAMAAGQGVPVVPVAITYDRPEIAWIGDDEFVPHFLSVFSRARTVARLAFGPELDDEDPLALRQRAWCWIERRLAASSQPQ
ncbi:MAG: 1-acyl-sn-glycerol-3-phosphate acyltransferase [Deltaproteobacteria bacterium]|nr:1-acyl-sn-glycerol-3-phosphate acyltransferase [Deltaproteobacteria bacterium]